MVCIADREEDLVCPDTTNAGKVSDNKRRSFISVVLAKVRKFTLIAAINYRFNKLGYDKIMAATLFSVLAGSSLASCLHIFRLKQGVPPEMFCLYN